jgi:phosphomannomutase
MAKVDPVATAKKWLSDDPDPVTRAATEALLAAGDVAAIADHFGSRLEFGTAGLRGALGPGPNRMNRALVRRVAAGLADYLLATFPDAAERGAVVGYDGRRGSREFAEDSACVLAGRGLPVHLYDRVSPTPELAFAVTYTGAVAGVMVTASHNPPQDNGYKVYGPNGAQVIPPHDAGISAAVDRIADLSGIRVPALTALQGYGLVVDVAPEVRAAYVDAVLKLRVRPDAASAGLSVVYTALHGVGKDLLDVVTRAAGYSGIHVVPEQAEPDGSFPTVTFPNPEEKGALDLATALAKKVGADLIVANDPDADRLAVAVKVGEGYRQLTGNEVGALLGAELLAHPGADKPLLATTIVSSTLLSRIAAKAGATYKETLTGFKWIAHQALDHEAKGGRFVLGFEEALGYSSGPVVRDKDGVSTALLLLDLASGLKRESRTLLDALADLYRIHGVHGSAQKNLTLPGADGAARIRAMMEALRASPPTAIAGRAVVRVTDVAKGTQTDVGTGAVSPIDLPKSNVLAFSLADGSRVLARPSGTEPKIKFYFEAVAPMGADEPLTAAEARIAGVLAELRASFDAVLEAALAAPAPATSAVPATSAAAESKPAKKPSKKG